MYSEDDIDMHAYLMGLIFISAVDLWHSGTEAFVLK